MKGPLIAGQGGLVRVIGHRGASGHGPENTLPVFQQAIKLGSDFVECDVHLARDGVPVVIHDPTLDRTTNGVGAVGEHTAEQIRKLDAGAWHGGAYAGARVPLLEEVLDLVRGACGLLVEIKRDALPGIEEAVAGRIVGHGATGHSAVIATESTCLKRLRLMAPSLHLALVAGPGSVDPVSSAAEAGANGLVLHQSLAEPQAIAAAHAAGLWVVPWTVDDPVAAEGLARMGVDGIITNYPDRLQPFRLRAPLPFLQAGAPAPLAPDQARSPSPQDARHAL